MVHRRGSNNFLASEILKQKPPQPQSDLITNGAHHQNGCESYNSISSDPMDKDDYWSNQPHKASHTVKSNGAINATHLLQTISDMPSYLQFNQYIVGGYRPLSSTWECIKSIFTLNNETVNILTHGIPLVYIMMNANTLLPWDEINVSCLPFIHIVAISTSWVGSFIYHLFMNHKTGEKTYNRLLNLDMLGIWFTESFGAVTTIYASIYCLPVPVHYFVFSFYTILSAIALHKALTADSPWERRCSFALQVGVRAVLLVLRLSPYGGGDPRSKVHVLLQDLLAIIGAVIGAVRIPERWYPGYLDFIGNSHHLMHILVVTAVVHMHKAAKLDLLWISNGGNQCIT
ncbi:hypothetical protein CHUAL_002629 [Chamberlinius hualienensis]